MGDDSPLRLKGIVLSTALLLFVGASNAKPIDYEDVADLLPTEPQTTNDTLAAIVRDPVVQDAVENAVGNGSLEGLVVKKKVVIMPATEPTKVVSQREQLLVVPMTHLEDVRKNITDTVNAETDLDDLALTDVQSFTEDNEDGSASSGNEGEPLYASRHDDFYEALAEISASTGKPTLPLDNTPQEIPYLLPDPRREAAQLPAERPSATISVPIIAFLDPARISDGRIDASIAAALPKGDDDGANDRLKLSLENSRDEIRRKAQNYVDASSLSVDPDNWRPASSSPQIHALTTLYEPAAIGGQYASDVRSESSLPPVAPSIGIVTPLFWTSDADINYPREPHDMDVAADIVFRPLFRFRQEAQRKSWRRGADNDYRRSPYRGYDSYNSYPRREYRYRPRYSDDYSY